MDEGKIPFVWAMSPSRQMERLAVAPIIMKELGLKQGQSVNSILVDAISAMSLRILTEKIEDITQEIYDQMLTDDFDFRKEMDK
jgi:hypothetical protein